MKSHAASLHSTSILRHILETACEEHQANLSEDLPSTPLKATEKRASRRREAFGIDQTQIDALTTPSKRSVLQRILRHAFNPYIDPTLIRRVVDAKTEWNLAAQEAVAEQIDADHLARIRQEASTKLGALREEIDRINEQVNVAAGEHFTLPEIEVPEPEVELDSYRQPLGLVRRRLGKRQSGAD